VRRFKVEIVGEALDRVRANIDTAGIPTVGPVEIGQPGEPSSTVASGMWALVEAPDADEAQRRLREHVHAVEGRHSVVGAKPYEPS
jgi:hypothetical protein